MLFFKVLVQWLLDKWETKAKCSLPLLLSQSQASGEETSHAVQACEYLKNRSFNKDFICRVAFYLII